MEEERRNRKSEGMFGHARGFVYMKKAWNGSNATGFVYTYVGNNIDMGFVEDRAEK